MLQESKDEIERTCIRSEGFEVDAQVVYGDTDSLFVRLPDTSVKDAFRLGKDIAARVSKIFPDPIQLEFQSVFFPSLLINRKRYCAMEWTNPDAANGVTAKGIESQRRDSSPILITVMNKVIDILMPKDKDNGPDGEISAAGRAGYIANAVDYLKWAIRRMLEGKNHAGEFVLTKGLWLGTESGDYKAKQPHVELVERMRKREPWREFKDGERIPFVYTAGAANAKAFEKSEDPAYALRNELPLDYQYYLVHQIENQLTRIFELMLPAADVQNLFHGDHTKVVARSSGSMRKGSIATFFNKPAEGGNCIWCRKLTKGKDPLCEECAPSVGCFRPGDHSREVVR
jgi:DNA polymerase delta subunit 1